MTLNDFSDDFLEEIPGDDVNSDRSSGVDSVLVEVQGGHRTDDVSPPDEGLNRHKVWHTICLYSSLLALGWRTGLQGPTFPDLRLIIDKDLSTASWIFTGFAVGGLLGSLLGGVAYDRFNKHTLLTGLMLCLSAVVAVTPWSAHFSAMIIVHIVNGALASAVDIAATADIALVWRERSGPFMQALHAMFSLGAILSPLTAEPFFSEIREYSERSSSANDTLPSFPLTATTSELLRNNTNSTDVSTLNVQRNRKSQLEILTEPKYLNTSGSNFTDMDIHIIQEYENTQIYLPFLFSTIVCLISVILYVFVTFKYGSIYKKILNQTGNTFSKSERKYRLTKSQKVYFTLLMAGVLILYVLVEHTMFQFYVTFLLSQQTWGKSSASTASSVFWMAFTAGRLVAVIGVRVLSNATVLVLSQAFLLAGGALLWLGTAPGTSAWITWLATSFIGFGMGPVFGCAFSWLAVNVFRLTGKVTSVLFLTTRVATMLSPILLGFLMDKLTPMAFVYFEFSGYIAMLLLTITIMVLHKLSSNVHITNTSVTSE